MCPHSINGPLAQSGAGRYNVTCCGSPLPVQNDGGVVTSRTGEAKVEKCLRSEIRTGKLGRKRRPYNDTRAVELQVGDDLRGYQHRRNIEFGAIRRTAWPVVQAARYQDHVQEREQATQADRG